MGNALKIFVLSVAITATLMTAGRKQQTATDSNPMAVRQIAHNMRAIHNVAINVKTASPADVGVLTGFLAQFLPPYLTDTRFTVCADAAYVATWTNTFSADFLTALMTEVQRQIVFPAGQYASFSLPAGYDNGVAAGNAAVPNIGMAQKPSGNTQTISTVFSAQSMPTGCQATAGSLVILTKVF